MHPNSARAKWQARSCPQCGRPYNAMLIPWVETRNVEGEARPRDFLRWQAEPPHCDRCQPTLLDLLDAPENPAADLPD